MSDVAVTVSTKPTFHDALADRTPTPLARYPRLLKLGVFLPILLLVVMALSGGNETGKTEKSSAVELSVSSETGDALQELKERLAGLQLSSKGVKFTPSAPQTPDQKEAASINDSDEPAKRMSPKIDPLLTQETTIGRLPTISPDGHKPWQAYARPFDFRDPRPRVAIVVGDMGLSRIATDAAIRRLPAGVTLAFDAQGGSIDAWLERARSEGHETLLSLPMEPFDYPQSDPGPQSLLTSLPNSDNIERLQRFLSVGWGYVGVTTASGSRFSADIDKLTPVLEELRRRGLLVLDANVTSRTTMGAAAQQISLPFAVSSITIDRVPVAEEIDEALAAVEQTARVQGSAVAYASPLPVTVDRLELWSKGLAQRGIVLAPVSAVVQ